MSESSTSSSAAPSNASPSTGTVSQDEIALEGYFSDASTLEAVRNYGVSSLHSLQSRVFLRLKAGEEVISECAAGPLRTVTLAYPLLEKGAGLLLVICPSEDHSRAAAAEFEKLGFTTEVLSFGESANASKVLKSTRGALLATPKGFLEHLRERTFEPNGITAVAIDGLDEMVGMGVSYELEALLSSIREEKGSLPLVAAASRFTPELMTFQKKNLSAARIERWDLGQAEFVIFHGYYELTGDLLSKPHALCDILEAEGTPTALIFCNSPSDVDLVEVVLRKRGIPSTKLVGYVPHLKLAKATHQVQTGEVNALVVTDVAAKGIDVESFAIVVNYSIHSDPEVYFHRFGHPREESRLRKVLSFIAPLDLINFNYLKKMGKFEMVRLELPARDGLGLSRLKRALEDGAKSVGAQDPALLPLVTHILEDENRDRLISILINNTLNVLPGLKSQPRGNDYADDEGGEYRGPRDRQENRGERERSDRDRGDHGNDRGGRGGDRQDRGPRQDRGGDRDGRRGPDRDRQPGARRGPDSQEEGDNRRNTGRRDEGDENGDQERERRPQRNFVTEKIVRAYIGQGSKNGLSAEKLTSLVEEVCGLPATSVKRSSVRDFYSFADFSEEDAAVVMEKLKDHPVGKEKLSLIRALTLSSTREVPIKDDEQGGHSQESDGATEGTDEHLESAPEESFEQA